MVRANSCTSGLSVIECLPFAGREKAALVLLLRMPAGTHEAQGVVRIFPFKRQARAPRHVGLRGGHTVSGCRPAPWQYQRLDPLHRTWAPTQPGTVNRTRKPQRGQRPRRTLRRFSGASLLGGVTVPSTADRVAMRKPELPARRQSHASTPPSLARAARPGRGSRTRHTEQHHRPGACHSPSGNQVARDSSCRRR